MMWHKYIANSYSHCTAADLGDFNRHWQATDCWAGVGVVGEREWKMKESVWLKFYLIYMCIITDLVLYGILLFTIYGQSCFNDISSCACPPLGWQENPLVSWLRGPFITCTIQYITSYMILNTCQGTSCEPLLGETHVMNLKIDQCQCAFTVHS